MMVALPELPSASETDQRRDANCAFAGFGLLVSSWSNANKLS